MIPFKQMQNLRPGAVRWDKDLRTVLWTLLIACALNSFVLVALAFSVIVLASR